MARTAEDTVTPGSLVGYGLEILGAVKQSLRRDVILKSVLRDVN